MLAHPGFQRIEPVLAGQWHDAIQACILLHGVVSCGGGQTANVGSLYLQEITPPANFLPTKRHDRRQLDDATQFQSDLELLAQNQVDFMSLILDRKMPYLPHALPQHCKAYASSW